VCSNELVKEKFDELEKFINEMPDKQGALIEVLHKAQNIFGYLPEEVQRFVSKQLNIPVAKIFGVITFYSYFTTEPKGEHVISICMGTACFVKGAGEIVKEFEKQLGIKAGETTEDGKFTIDVLRCIGACGLAPVLTVNERVIGHVTTAAQVKNILKEYQV
jgi:NADH-quinone oxidoreductase subunit E